MLGCTLMEAIALGSLHGGILVCRSLVAASRFPFCFSVIAAAALQVNAVQFLAHTFFQ